MRSKNLLITGGAGFIGSNFIDIVINKYTNTNTYDCPYPENINHKYITPNPTIKNILKYS